MKLSAPRLVRYPSGKGSAPLTAAVYADGVPLVSDSRGGLHMHGLQAGGGGDVMSCESWIVVLNVQKLCGICTQPEPESSWVAGDYVLMSLCPLYE